MALPDRREISHPHCGLQIRTGQASATGAQTSAIIYSLIETSKEMGMDPYHYFTYTLQAAAQLAADGKEDEIARLTPAHF